MFSPYPLLPTLRLPFNYLRPSTTGRNDLSCAPLEAEIVPCSDARGVTITLVGDLMLTRGGTVPRVDDEIRELLARSDLVIGNCEGPVMAKAAASPLLIRERLRPEFIQDLLQELGVTPDKCVLSVANNHAGDYGSDGLSETVEHLTELGVIMTGQARTPLGIARVGNLTVGVVGWTDLMNHDVFTRETGVTRTHRVLDEDWVQLRGKKSLDCLIGFPHWDFEFRHFPSVATRTVAQLAIEKGFDLIVGHHPHVLQPIELSPHGLIAYSLGNLTGPKLPVRSSSRLGGLLEIRLGLSNQRRWPLLSYKLHPCAQVPGYPVALVRLEHAPESLRHRLNQLLKLLFPLSTDLQISK